MAATVAAPLAGTRTAPPKGRVLQVIGPSYRLSREEHGSSVVWDTRALAGGAGAFGLLLRADAVAYAMRGAGAASAPESHDGASDGVARLVENGVDVRYVEEDARERGLESLHLIDGVRPLKESDVPRHLSGYELVWRSRVESGLLVL